jgi:hypothetical protein
MKPRSLALLLAALPVAAIAGTAEVQFIHPDLYNDAGQNRVGHAEHVRHELRRYFDKLAAEFLPADQSVQIEVLNIELAGTPPIRGDRQDGPRVLRGLADWPQIELRYTLRAGDKVLASGHDVVSDLAYLDSSTIYPARDESLPYEKRMLKRWFVQRFAPAAAPRAG